MSAKHASQNTSQTGRHAEAIAALEHAREKGYISEKQFGESIASLTSQVSSGGKAKTQWVELDSFPVSVSAESTRSVNATKKVAVNGTTTYGVSRVLNLNDGTQIPKGFTSLEMLDNEILGLRAMQKRAKAAEKANE